MEQKKIRTTEDAIVALVDAISGGTENGTAIGLKQNIPATLEIKKQDLVGADNGVAAAQAELKTRRTALTVAVAAGIAHATLCRDMLKPRFGNTYSTRWDEAGFVGSMKLPRSLGEVLFKLQRLNAFFTAHPEAESADSNVTATRCQVIMADIVTRQNAVTTQEAVLGDAVKARKAALKKAAAAIGNLVGELKGLIDPLDMRYLSFGLNRPGAFAVPNVPEAVTVVLTAPNAALVKWKAAARAEHYRVWIKVNGVDQELRAVGSRNVTDFTIEGLPANSTIEVAVSAVNNGGESLTSQVVTVVTN